MTDPIASPRAANRLESHALGSFIEGRRWYASKSRSIISVHVAESVALSADPALELLLVRIGFADGGVELYQLPVTLLTAAQADGRSRIATAGDLVAVDAVADPELCRDLLRRIDEDVTFESNDADFRFRRVPGAGDLTADAPARPMGVEQSNSSIVFGDDTVLKVFRRLEPGINPEIEMLHFLTEHEYPSIAPLLGWYEVESGPLFAHLGVAQRFLADATGGWELALARIVSDPDGLLAELGDLGTVTAQLHNALACDPADPAFASEPASSESIAALTAAISADIERVFVRLPDDERLSRIAGRGPDVRATIADRAPLGTAGRAIRTHGDFHLGQTLHRAGGPSWVIIDFEGEPARPLPERRQKRSPLRDVAGMLRSFAYVASATRIQRGVAAPDAFEDRARSVYLDHYLAAIDPGLLPDGEAATMNLLSIFELEKVIYELSYELDNRPDWLPIPVAGIARLLEST